MKRLALLLMAACSSDGGGHCYSVDPNAWIAGAYQAPAVPTQYEPLSAHGGGARVRFDPSVPRSFRTVWWTGSQDLAMRWEFSLASHVGTLRDARVIMLLDGLQRGFVIDGGRADFLPLQVAAGTMGGIDLRIAAADVAPGAHSLNLIAIDAATGNFWESWSSTVIKDSDARFAERPDHTAQAKLGRGDHFEIVTSGGAPIYLNKPIANVSADGTWPIEAQLEPVDGDLCAADRAPVLFTVLVDFKQRTLEGYGPFVRLLLTQDQAATFQTRVLDMPKPDGTKHVVTLVFAQGDGAYGEGPVGSFNSFVSDPAAVSWGTY